MKAVSREVIISAMFLLGVASQAEVVDLLKPEYQKKEQAVQKLMDGFAEKGITYDIIHSQKMASMGNGPLGSLLKYKVYAVSLPGDISNKVHSLDGRVKNEMLIDSLDMEKYSFYAAVLMVENCGDKFVPDGEAIGWRPKQEMFDGIVKKDKKLWDAQLHAPLSFLVNEDERFVDVSERKVRRDIFLDSYFRAVSIGSYKNTVLYESIPKVYDEELFKATNDVWKIYFGAKKSLALTERVRRPYVAFTNGSAMAFARVCTIYKFPLLHEWDDMRIQDTQRLLKICRDTDPATKPYLSALMMGLFTVDAYSFNDETGVYTMKERGKMLMDFIVEFPIPENATRLKAVMDGGNRDEIQAMMKRHNTEEKWKTLLQNPVHPEFAKYPQD